MSIQDQVRKQKERAHNKIREVDIARLSEALHIPKKKEHSKPGIISKTTGFIADVAIESYRSAVKTIKSLYKNAESVVILSFAALGITSVIGAIEIGAVPVASPLLFGPAIPAVISVSLVWGLIRISMARKNYRLAHA